MKDKVEKLIVEWLKSDNENATYLAHQICVLFDVSGSAFPEGFKVYKCTDCQTINVLKDNGEITVGFCSNCEHPLWND